MSDEQKNDLPYCPECGADTLIKVHHDSTFALPECTVLECDNCGYKSEPN